MTNPAVVFVSAMQQFMFQVIGFIPKLIISLIIWIIGKYLINSGVNLLKRIQVKKAKAVNRLVESLVFVLLPLGKVVLFLVILDYLGIGRTVINALLSGITFAIAIALGLAFGKALEDDAKEVVKQVKEQLEK